MKQVSIDSKMSFVKRLSKIEQVVCRGNRRLPYWDITSSAAPTSRTKTLVKLESTMHNAKNKLCSQREKEESQYVVYTGPD